ncbi:hypothetical protein ACFLQL_00695 [Verrucomicrobiota bacterium]
MLTKTAINKTINDASLNQINYLKRIIGCELTEDELKGLDELKFVIELEKTARDLFICQTKIRAESNDVYVDLLADRPASEEGKELILNGAALHKNSNKSKWVYPEEIKELEKKLLGMKKQAEKDGTAEKIAPKPLDPGHSFLFKIKTARI